MGVLIPLIQRPLCAAEEVHTYIYALFRQRKFGGVVRNVENIQLEIQPLDELFVHQKHLWILICDNIDAVARQLLKIVIEIKISVDVAFKYRFSVQIYALKFIRNIVAATLVRLQHFVAQSAVKLTAQIWCIVLPYIVVPCFYDPPFDFCVVAARTQDIAAHDIVSGNGCLFEIQRLSASGTSQ